MTLPVDDDDSPDARAHGTLPERTYQQLRDLIVRGRIAPGVRVVEEEVAFRFGVSRTPVREALARLIHEGYLIPATSGRRTEVAVAPLATDNVRELWGIIGSLEGYAIRAISNLTVPSREVLASDLERLNRELRRASNARPRNPDQLLKVQASFHERFINETAGPRLLSVYSALRPQVERYEWVYGTRLDAEYEPSASEHLRIIAAIRSGDGLKARDAVEVHWSCAALRTIAIIERIASQQKPRVRKP